MIGTSASSTAQKSLLPPPLHVCVQDLLLRFETGRAASRVYARDVAEALAQKLNKKPDNRLSRDLVYEIVDMAWHLDAKDACGVVRHIGAAMNLVDAPQNLAQPASREFAGSVGRRLGLLTRRREENPIPAELATAIMDQALLIDQHTSPVGSVRSMGAALGLTADPAAAALCAVMRCIEAQRPILEALDRWRMSLPEHRKGTTSPDLFDAHDDLYHKLNKVKLNLPEALHDQLQELIKRLASDELSKDHVSFLQNFHLLSGLVEGALQPLPARYAHLSARSEDVRKETLAERYFTELREHLGMYLSSAQRIAQSPDTRIAGDVKSDVNELIRCVAEAAALLSPKTQAEVRQLIEQISQAFGQQQPVAFGMAWVSLHETVMSAHHEMNRARWTINEQIG